MILDLREGLLQILIKHNPTIDPSRSWIENGAIFLLDPHVYKLPGEVYGVIVSQRSGLV
jgi:hypothetical protein